MVEVKHNIGQNQDLYNKYDIAGSDHNHLTSQLCEVIHDLEALLTRVLVVEGDCNINLCKDIRTKLNG